MASIDSVNAQLERLRRLVDGQDQSEDVRATLEHVWADVDELLSSTRTRGRAEVAVLDAATRLSALLRDVGAGDPAERDDWVATVGRRVEASADRGLRLRWGITQLDSESERNIRALQRRGPMMIAGAGTHAEVRRGHDAYRAQLNTMLDDRLAGARLLLPLALGPDGPLVAARVLLAHYYTAQSRLGPMEGDDDTAWRRELDQRWRGFLQDELDPHRSPAARLVPPPDLQFWRACGLRGLALLQESGQRIAQLNQARALLAGVQETPGLTYTRAHVRDQLAEVEWYLWEATRDLRALDAACVSLEAAQSETPQLGRLGMYYPGKRAAYLTSALTWLAENGTPPPAQAHPHLVVRAAQACDDVAAAVQATLWAGATRGESHDLVAGRGSAVGDGASLWLSIGAVDRAVEMLERRRHVLFRGARTDRPAQQDIAEALECVEVLVHLLPGVLSGYALVHRREAHPLIIELPALSTGFQGGDPGVVTRYRAGWGDRVSNRGAWRARVRSSLREIADDIVGPLLRQVSLAGRRVALVPVGSLGDLPLHAALMDGTAAPASVTYAPSAAALVARRPRAASRPSGAWSAIAVAQSVGSDRAEATRSLGALREGLAVTREMNTWFPCVGGRPLVEQDATVARVVELLPEAELIHVSCHAVLDDHEPQDSRLLLQDGPLDFRRISGLDLQGARIAVLAACSTHGQPLWLPDEVSSLAGLMHEAGVRACIGTLWPVDDEATAVFLRFFYPALRRGGDPRAAFTTAVTRLRTVTREELQRVKPRGDPAHEWGRGGSRPRFVLGDGARASPPFADPVHWAAYVYIGT